MPASKMHVDQIDIDDELVRRLLAEQFPQWAELPLKRVASAGTINAIYRLGDGMSLRLPFIHWGLRDVEKEEYWLPKLTPVLPLPIPEILERGEPGQGYPFTWSIHRWLHGQAASPETVAAPVRFAVELAEFTTALWRVDPSGEPYLGTTTSLPAQDADVRAAIKELNGVIDAGAATAVWDAALQASPWSRPPLLVHSDLLPGNLLTLDGSLAAVIDFGALSAGDPATDLLPAWSLFDGPARQVFRDGVQVDDATWLRGRGHALLKGLMALPYYQDTNPEFAALARHMIDAVLADSGPER